MAVLATPFKVIVHFHTHYTRTHNVSAKTPQEAYGLAIAATEYGARDDISRAVVINAVDRAERYLFTESPVISKQIKAVCN